MSAEGRYLDRVFDGDDHPFLDDIRVTIEDSRGFMWIGSNEALLFYDGVDFLPVDINGADTVMAIAEDESGRIWIGANGELGYIDRVNNGGFEYRSLISHLDQDDPLPSNVWNLLFVGDTVFWIEEKNVYQWDGTTMATWPLPNAYRLTSFIIDGELWIHQRNVGLRKWDGESFVTVYADSDIFREGIIEVALVGGHLQFYTFSGKVLILEEGEFKEKYDLAEDVFDLTPWQDGFLVAGEKALFYQKGEHIEKIYELAEGYFWQARVVGNDVWAGSSNGLIHVRTNGSELFETGLVLGMTETPDGDYLLGTQAGGMIYKDGSFRKLGSELAFNVSECNEGYVIAGMWEVKLMGASEGVKLDNIAAIHTLVPIGDDPSLYLGYGVSGLQLFRVDSELSAVGEFVRMAWQYPNSFTMVNDKTFYIGSTNGGLWRGTITSDDIQSAEDIEMFIVQPRAFGVESVAWARPFMMGEHLLVLCNTGLYLYNSQQQRFYRTNAFEKDFLKNNPFTIQASVEDERTLWVIFSNKEGAYILRRLDRKGNDFASSDFFVPEAEEVDPIAWFKYVKAEDVFIFGGNGLVRYLAPDSSHSEPTQEPVLIFADNGGEEVSIENLTAAFPLSGFELRHVSPSAIYERIEYRTKIGDREWSEFSPKPVTKLSKLWPGEYVVSVQARSIDGSFSDVSSFDFTVRTPWWMEWYNLAIAATSSVLSISLLLCVLIRPYRRRVQSLEKEIEVEGKVSERSANSGNRMLKDIKHEIEEPINAARANLYLLNDMVEKDPIAQMHCAKSMDLMDTVMRMVSGMIQFPKMINGKAVVCDAPFNIYDIRSELIGVFEPKAEKQNVVLSIPKNMDKLEAVYLRGDRGKLFQVISNLAGNAIRHAGMTDQLGLVRVVLASVRVGDGKAKLMVAVSDNGPGVQSHLKKKIFSSYFSTGDEKQNLGLGLYLSQILVEAMGGKLEIRDNTPRGAVFQFELVLEVAEGADSTSTSNTQKHQ
ncbi:MAG: ATP-binding protein [Verrucomicrobiota bacterium]